MDQLSNYWVSKHLKKKPINTPCLKQIELFVIYAIFTVKQNVLLNLNTILFSYPFMVTYTEPQQLRSFSVVMNLTLV